MLIQYNDDGIIGGMNKQPPKNTVKLTEKYVKALVTLTIQKVYDERGLYLYVMLPKTRRNLRFCLANFNYAPKHTCS